MSGSVSKMSRSSDGRPTWADVDAVRDASLAATDVRWRGGVERVYSAVKALAESGTGVTITVEAVGKWCTDRHGGPSAPSIRNNPRLVAIVRVAASTRSTVRRSVGDRPVELAFIEALDDPKMKSDLAGLLAHRRHLIVENSTLRLAASRLEAISFLSREMAEVGLETLEELAASIRSKTGSSGGLRLNIDELEACRHFLQVGLCGAGLSVDEVSGEIIDRVKRTVARPGVVSALRKIIDVGVDEAGPGSFPSKVASGQL